MSSTTATAGVKRSHNQGVRSEEALLQRAAHLCSLEIAFIPNDDFSTRTKVRPCQVWKELTGASAAGGERSGTATLGGEELLTPPQEREMFLRMNFLKFRAKALQKRLSPTTPQEELLVRSEKYLAEAEAIRNRLITANMRLVMSIAKKFASPQYPFDELVSEGSMTLMRSVDKFDAARGFRFSTYAYRSVMRHLYRSVMNAQKDRARVVDAVEESSLEQPESASASTAVDGVWQNIRAVAYDMLDALDRRERFIIRSRYALGAHRKPRTFQYLADKLGISKERARQLEGRAVGKLQAMAGEHDLDELFGPALS